jgi:hypothetical protein
MRGRANGWAVVPGDVDDRHRNVRFFETVPQRDTRDIAQVDVENDANSPSQNRCDLRRLPPKETARFCSPTAAAVALRSSTSWRRHRRTHPATAPGQVALGG